MNQIFTLPKARSDGQLDRIVAVIRGLSPASPWQIDIREQKSKRSDAQNRYLWGVCYQTILDAPGMEGWNKDDVHQYMLGEHFGWETVEMFGKKRLRPLRRSSRLSKLEFMDYVAFIQQFMAERGVYIADPV